MYPGVTKAPEVTPLAAFPPYFTRVRFSAEHLQQTQGKSKSLRSFLHLSGRTATCDPPHQKPQIESCRMDQQPLQDIRVSAQMRSSHRSGSVHMSEASLYLLATLSQ
jgi:hypothetical protein